LFKGIHNCLNKNVWNITFFSKNDGCLLLCTVGPITKKNLISVLRAITSATRSHATAKTHTPSFLCTFVTCRNSKGRLYAISYNDDVTSGFPNDDVTWPPKAGNLTRFRVTSDVIFRVPSCLPRQTSPLLLSYSQPIVGKRTLLGKSNLTPFRSPTAMNH